MILWCSMAFLVAWEMTEMSFSSLFFSKEPCQYSIYISDSYNSKYYVKQYKCVYYFSVWQAYIDNSYANMSLKGRSRHKSAFNPIPQKASVDDATLYVYKFCWKTELSILMHCSTAYYFYSKKLFPQNSNEHGFWRAEFKADEPHKYSNRSNYYNALKFFFGK